MANDEQRSSGAVGHDETVPYQDEVAAYSAIDVQRWEWWSHADAGYVHYYAKGPCPACHAETQGHFADLRVPIEGQGRETTLPKAGQDASEEVEIPLKCLCGTDHGQPGAGGCGRHWSIIGPKGAP